MPPYNVLHFHPTTLIPCSPCSCPASAPQNGAMPLRNSVSRPRSRDRGSAINPRIIMVSTVPAAQPARPRRAAHPPGLAGRPAARRRASHAQRARSARRADHRAGNGRTLRGAARRARPASRPTPPAVGAAPPSLHSDPHPRPPEVWRALPPLLAHPVDLPHVAGAPAHFILFSYQLFLCACQPAFTSFC